MIHSSFRLVVAFVRLSLGAILLWAGLAKMRDPYDFLGSVYSYELVGPQLGLWVAMILPWLELLAGASLVLMVAPLGGAFLATVLFALFTVVQAIATGDGLAVSCGCGIGSPDVAVTGPGKLLATAGLLLSSILVLVSFLRRPTLDG